MQTADTPAEIAADLIAEIGAPDAIDWLEGRLYVCDDEREAERLCTLIDAVEAAARATVH